MFFQQTKLTVDLVWRMSCCRRPVVQFIIEAIGYVDVYLSTNNQEFKTSGLQFEFAEPAIIHSVNPPRGSVGGGAVVQVSGQGFSAEQGKIRCRFWDLLVPVSQFVTSTYVECVSPGDLKDTCM